MRRISFKIAVAFLAFIIGTSFTAFWFIKTYALNQILQNDTVLVEEDDDYAVYSAAINELFIKEKDSINLLAISNQTSFDDYFNDITSVKRATEMKEYYPSVSEETLYDFVVKNMQSSKLSRDFNLSVTYSLINNEEEFEKYRASGMIRLSGVRFNKDKTQAFLYAEYLFCPLCSRSDHLLLEKEKGSWTIKKVFAGMRS